MRVCLMIEGQQGVDWDDWLALARACEEARLEALFRSDHYLGIGGSESGSLDAWTTLAGIAARTERIRLGTLVSPVTFRHPSLLAKAAATVDHISGGRVDLGIGAGWYEAEHRAYGFPFPPLRERMEQFEEQIEIVHRQWSGERFSFEGRHYRLEDCLAELAPLQQPHPPIVVGGDAKPRSLAAAVRFADEYNVFDATPARCREVRAAIERACEAGGRDPATLPLSLMATTVLASSAEEARLRAREIAGGDVPESWLVGSVADVAPRLRELAETGVVRLMCQHLRHRDLDAVALMGELAEA